MRLRRPGKKIGSFGMVWIALIVPSLMWGAFLPEERINRRSARLDALQLRVVTEDSANKIGLERWGGNPAGLVDDEENSRVMISQTVDDVETPGFIDATTGGPADTKTTWPAAYAVLRTARQAVAAHASRQLFQHGQGDDTQNSFGLGYAARLGGWRLGAEVVRLTETLERVELVPFFFEPFFVDSNYEYQTEPVRWGAGIGYEFKGVKNSLALGASSNRNESRTGDDYSPDLLYFDEEYVVQIVYRRRGVLGLGLLGRDYSKSALGIDEDSQRITTRGLWRGRLLRLGWEGGWSNLSYDDTEGFRTRTNIEQAGRALTVGIAAADEGRWLLGLENEWSRSDDDFEIRERESFGPFTKRTYQYEMKASALTLGGEATWKRLSLRTSYGIFKQDAYDVTFTPYEVEGESVGAGLGFSFSSTSALDVSWNRVTSDFSPSGSEAINATRLNAQLNVGF